MKMKKVVAMVSALAMVAGLCTSAAADEAATDSDLSEHVEITIGGINMGSSDTKEGWLSARSNGLLSLSKCQVIVNGNEAVLKTVVEKSASGFESQAWRLME